MDRSPKWNFTSLPAKSISVMSHFRRFLRILWVWKSLAPICIYVSREEIYTWRHIYHYTRFISIFISNFDRRRHDDKLSFWWNKLLKFLLELYIAMYALTVSYCCVAALVGKYPNYTVRLWPEVEAGKGWFPREIFWSCSAGFGFRRWTGIIMQPVRSCIGITRWEILALGPNLQMIVLIDQRNVGNEITYVPTLDNIWTCNNQLFSEFSCGYHATAVWYQNLLGCLPPLFCEFLIFYETKSEIFFHPSYNSTRNDAASDKH